MTAPGPRITSFLVKLASRCNLDCDYCYVYHHADQAWRAMPRLLSGENRAAFAERLAKYVQREGIQRCVVIFHGGEPLLAGAETIVEFSEQLREAIGGSASLDIGLQTNGLLLDEPFVVALEQANIGVSLSLDGPAKANDLHRNTRRGRSSFKKAFAALERLKRHRKIFAGVIAVVDPRISPEELFEFFHTHSPPKIDFLLPDAHHLRPPPERSVDPDVYSDWLIRAFDLWLDKYPELPVRTFEALLDATAGLPSGTDAFGLGDVSLLTIETDGSYHDLDVLKIVGNDATRLAGSVRDTEIADVAESSAIAKHRWHLRKEGLCEICQNCAEVGVCGGGSLPHRWGSDGFNQPTVYCGEMLTLIRHIRARLEGGLAAETVPEAPRTPDFELEQFELVESAAPVVAQLWEDARAEYSAALLSVLDQIGFRHTEFAPIICEFKKLDPVQLADLASRPGAIAWQKAMTGLCRDKAMYSVDGSPLVIDVRYPSWLLRRPTQSPAIEVGVDDPWLRIPFGTSIVFEASDITAQAKPLVQDAFEIIAGWRPGLADEIRKVSRAIQFVRDPTADPEKIVSFSDNTVPGALFVSVTQGDSLIDPFDLADSIIHEHRHQKLYLLERLFPVVGPTNLKVVSPWREELRPPSGLLHAVFVFVELLRFWEHVRDRGPARLRLRAVNQVAETNARLEQGLQTLDDCPLTPLGHALTAVLKKAWSRPRIAA